jgi:hypothetical protein
VSGQRETVWRMISLLTYGNARHCQDPRIAGVDRTDREMRSFSQNETHNLPEPSASLVQVRNEVSCRGHGVKRTVRDFTYDPDCTFLDI